MLTFNDGLGVRRIAIDPVNGGLVETLDIAPELAAYDGFEAALRTRAARLAGAPTDHLSVVRRVERHGNVLRVVADQVDGLRLPDLLQEAQRAGVEWSAEAAMALSAEIVRVVAALHRTTSISHGAITPAHIVVSRKGVVTLTDAIFGPALELLNLNREHLWRRFGVALPPSATLPRFDRRGDVTALGATVLAVILGRGLRAEEYPRGIADLVMDATRARHGDAGSSQSALRTWLQHALCLHPRSTLSTAVDAEQVFAAVEGPPMTRQVAAAALRSRLRRIYGVTPASANAARIAAAWSQPGVVHSTASRPLPSEPVTIGSDSPTLQESPQRRAELPVQSVLHNTSTN